MIGQLTTHVLDTAQGRPAANMAIELWWLEMRTAEARQERGGDRQLLKQTVTNSDGRTEQPLLTAGKLKVGLYEINFGVGEYFAQQPVVVPIPAFLDWVPIRFGVADANGHYHVPLLVSPWAYSTYRGS